MSPTELATWADLRGGAPWLITWPILAWLALPLALLPVLLLPRQRPLGERARNLGVALLRGLTLALLALAAAGPVLELQEPDLGVALVVDRSSSMRGPRGEDAQAQAELRLGALPEAARARVVRVEGDPEDSLERLLARAAAAVPAARTRRVLLLSDGAQPGALPSPEAAVPEGVQVFPIPPGLPAWNAGIHGLDAPLELREGQPGELLLTLWATQALEGLLTVQVGGRGVVEQALTLAPGAQTLRLPVRAPGAGVYPVEATLRVAGDLWPEDDRRQAWLRATGEGPVWVLGPEAEALARRLQAQGARAQALTGWPARFPEGAALWLLSPELEAWPPGRAAALAAAVREGGLDLLITGGREGLSADAAHLEPLARALPAVLPRRKDREPPPLAVVYAVDVSASMAREGKLALARGALLSSAQMLSPEARVGVLAFTDTPRWALPMSRARDPGAVVGALDGVQPQGGTRLYPALEEALDAVEATEAALKHVVLLSDGAGMDRGSQHLDLLDRLAASSVTVSTVALSAEADRAELERIANAGRGRSWAVGQPEELPRVFVDETLLMLRRNISESSEQPLPTPGSALAGRARWDEAPRLGGWNRARARPTAELGLAVGRSDQPLLLSWRYGLGSATLFTSQLLTGWGAAWATWPGLDPWLAELLAATRRRDPERLLAVDLRPEAAGLGLSVRAVDRLGNLREGARAEVRARGEGGERVLPLEEQAPGLYAAELPWDGALLLTLTVSGGADPPAVALAQAAPPAPAELRGPLGDLQRLRALAAATGGELLPEPAAFATAGLRTAARPRAAWPWPLGAALGLLPLEVLLRRLRRPGRRA